MPKRNTYKKIWDKLPFPKPTYQIFYNRLHKWKTVEEAANPDPIPFNKKSEKRLFWDNYKWIKPDLKTFLSRVKSWRTLQEAIHVWRLERRDLQPPKEEVKLVLKKNHKQKQMDKYNPENYFIRVTMNAEEAKSYHRTYRSMIAELEDKIYNLEDTSTLAELNKKLEFIKQQYQVFLSFNPINHGTCN